MNSRTHKISDSEFWSALKANGGDFPLTALFIQTKYGIKYSRQAVFQRAKRKAEMLEEIIEETLDLAEEGLHELIKDSRPNIQLQAIKYYLRAKKMHRN